jgi:ABC transporter DrrB family efflux protein
MTTAVLTPTAPVKPPSSLRLAVSDAITMTWRNLRAMTRVPEVIVFSTIQPIIFVLTFRYVFGGAVNTGPVEYVDFLMPGIFVQTVAFGAMNTGVGLSEDLAKGLVERFRSLPMARSAVLAGRTSADVVRNLLVVALMIVVGFLVGFDIYGGWVAFGFAVLLLLAFGFAMSWVFALVALSVPNAEAAQAASFPILAVLVFASDAFVPVESMPGWLQAYNEVNPVSIVVNAVRKLCLGDQISGDTLALVLKALACIAGLLVVFVPLAVAKYRRAV